MRLGFKFFPPNLCNGVREQRRALTIRASARNGPGETQPLPRVVDTNPSPRTIQTVTVSFFRRVLQKVVRAIIETKRNETKHAGDAAVVVIHVSRVRISGSFIFGGFPKEGHYSPQKSIINRRPLSGLLYVCVYI